MSSMPSVLIADDSEASRAVLADILEPEPCQIVTVVDGMEVLALVEREVPDLILLDDGMRGLDGFEVCRRIRQGQGRQRLPIVMMSSRNDVAHRVEALDAGADDFLSKPVERPELLARVRSLLRLKSISDRLEDTLNVVLTLARVEDAKDGLTHAHSQRVADHAYALADRLALGQVEKDQIRTGAIIHDIGKIAVPDQILGKPGSLTPDEFEVVKTHCVAGARIVAPLSSQPLLGAIVRHHHERYDGLGYPDGLRGEEIPLGARIVAICDSFDAMVSNRPYRPALSVERAAAVLAAGRNEQWDGRLVDAFLDIVANPASID